MCMRARHATQDLRPVCPALKPERSAAPPYARLAGPVGALLVQAHSDGGRQEGLGAR